jgi:hypothetical protein
VTEGLSIPDVTTVSAQLRRPARDVISVAHRCPCGLPDVVRTAPRLADGSPFPTLYYLTCPRAAGEIGRLEAGGLMARLAECLRADPDLALRYRAAHVAYLQDRERLSVIPEIAGVSAGGMPDRVKCLHALAAHALAVGTGVNPVGDAALERLPHWWTHGPCVVTPVDVDG